MAWGFHHILTGPILSRTGQNRTGQMWGGMEEFYEIFGVAHIDTLSKGRGNSFVPSVVFVEAIKKLPPP